MTRAKNGRKQIKVKARSSDTTQVLDNSLHWQSRHSLHTLLRAQGRFLFPELSDSLWRGGGCACIDAKAAVAAALGTCSSVLFRYIPRRIAFIEQKAFVLSTFKNVARMVTSASNPNPHSLESPTARKPTKAPTNTAAALPEPPRKPKS